MTSKVFIILNLATKMRLSFFSVCLICFQLVGCAYAPWQENRAQGKVEESQVTLAKKLSEENPESTRLRKDLLIINESSIMQLLAKADLALSSEKYQEASDSYEQILSINPENSSAINGKLEVEKKLALQKKMNKASELNASNQTESALELLQEVLLESPQNNKAIKLKQEIIDSSSSLKAKPLQLKPQFDRPVTLELRDANIKVVFEAMSRATGINFVLDKDIKPDTKVTVFIKKMKVEDAIDMVLSSNGLQKKALSENTALVFPSTQQKLKDYQDLMIRSFYFTNTSAKQVAVLLKTMLKTKDIYVDDRLNMLVMRDTPEVVRIAEKLVAANDLEDPEVMLDIEVLEVSRSRLQELGIVYPNQLAVLSAEKGLTLEALKLLKSTQIGVSPNPAVNFKKTTGDLNVLSNPRIRVKNNEKAKILVGDKVPIITTTSTANVGISESVQYVDVGLKLDVEPRITLDNFVNIKVGLEVSSLGEKTVTKNGATVYTIGTRNASTVLRLKNGETQILAGLILDDERKNASKLPGLGDIPLIGRLFSNHEDKRSKTEIVLAITPRMIGNISLPKAEVSEYFSGTENLITDKPQVIIPASNTDAPKTTIERMREKIRSQQNANQETTSSLPVIEAPTPTVNPDGTSNQVVPTD